MLVFFVQLIDGMLFIFIDEAFFFQAIDDGAEQFFEIGLAQSRFDLFFFVAWVVISHVGFDEIYK